MAVSLSDRGEAEVEDLIHHGVKGQKWGVIRKKASAGRKATIKAIQKSGRFTANATKTTIKTARTGAAKVQKAKQAHAQRVAGKNSLTKAGTYAATKAMKTAFDKSFDPGKTGKSTAETLKKAAEKAKEAAEAASVVAEEAKSEARSVGGPALKKAKTPKQIEKPKSFKQTKPTPKPKPRNPGSPLK